MQFESSERRAVELLAGDTVQLLSASASQVDGYRHHKCPATNSKPPETPEFLLEYCTLNIYKITIDCARRSILSSFRGCFTTRLRSESKGGHSSQHDGIPFQCSEPFRVMSPGPYPLALVPRASEHWPLSAGPCALFLVPTASE